ncbi:MAG: hypothetical protein MHPSP_001915, partial [Paramarteilia canceri]
MRSIHQMTCFLPYGPRYSPNGQSADASSHKTTTGIILHLVRAHLITSSTLIQN